MDESLATEFSICFHLVVGCFCSQASIDGCLNHRCGLMRGRQWIGEVTRLAQFSILRGSFVESVLLPMRDGDSIVLCVPRNALDASRRASGARNLRSGLLVRAGI